MPRIDIEKATTKQIRDFADLNLGLMLKDNLKKDEIIALMADAGYGLSHIMLPDEAAPVMTQSGVQGAISTRINETTGKKEVKINLHKNQGPGGEKDLFVGVNGVGMTIPRGKPVWVPEAYVSNLMNAVELHYPQQVRDDVPTPPPVEVPAYPFSFVA